MNNFKYLGTVVEETGYMDKEIRHRVSAAWGNWKKCSEVFSDRNIPEMLNGKILYRTVVRPALVYVTETWSTTTSQYKVLHRCEEDQDAAMDVHSNEDR